MLHCIIPWEREAAVQVGNYLDCAPCRGIPSHGEHSSECVCALSSPAAPQSPSVHRAVAHTAPCSALKALRDSQNRLLVGLLGSGSRKAPFGVGLWDRNQAPTQTSAFNFPDLLV